MKTGNGKAEIGTWEEAERAMASLAAAESSRRRIQAEIDSAIAAVHKRYEEILERESASIDETEAALAKFAKKHKREFRARDEGGETRSHEHAGVTMGFRRTPEKVKAQNEEFAIRWLVESSMEDYLRRTVALDRESILRALKDDSENSDEPLLSRAGIELKEGKDKFFCEVKEQK